MKEHTQDHGHGQKDQKQHDCKEHNSHDNVIEFFLDGEEFKTKTSPLTANDILKIAGLDPEKNYLVKIYVGRPGDSFEDKGNEKIDLKNCDKFVAVSNGPTPVS